LISILDWEVVHPLGEKGGLHQVVSEMIFICRFQVKEIKEIKETKELDVVLCV
jgi:hypothetical protein